MEVLAAAYRGVASQAKAGTRQTPGGHFSLFVDWWITPQGGEKANAAADPTQTISLLFEKMENPARTEVRCGERRYNFSFKKASS
jgi:hypothetical protein